MVDSHSKIIDGFSLENILQIFSLEKKSQTIKVHKEGRTGLLDIDQGEIVCAEFGTIVGMPAAIEILQWEDVQIEIQPLRLVIQIINTPLINILLEVSRIKDERKSLLEESGETLLNGAIAKAELQQYKEAHQDLASYLKTRRNNAMAWVWYSRVQGNTEIMAKALKQAVALEPNNPEVKEEQEKFTAASKHLTEKIVRKCYFCWAPLNKSAPTCPWCHAHLLISRDALSKAGSANPQILAKTKERYSRILSKHPRHLAALYCLSLVSINCGRFQEALSFLDKAAKIAPDRALFTNHLKLLLDHLAQHSSEDSDDEREKTVVPAPPVQTVHDNQKLILVVEDSPTTRKVISITLSRQGYRVIEAGDGLEALSKISEERPDLIMLDVILPKMDGYKILSIVKGNKEFKDIPVIMLTSKDGFINKMKGKMAGSAAYLTKPFDPAKMIAEVSKHLVSQDRVASINQEHIGV
jgi:twitching motility two-component system response regulator PilG